MGNQIEVSKKKNTLKLSVIQNKQNYIHPIVVAKPSTKAQFCYIQPLILDSQENKNQDQLLKYDQMFRQSIPQITQINAQQLDSKFQNNVIEKISVSWNSFVKIKKKNYLEDYIFIKEIGKGAYGAVSKVKMKYGGLFRAAKTIKASILMKDKLNSQKLNAEVAIPMRLDHPNINKLYEVFQWRNQLVLINELCQGGDLFQRIKSNRNLSESKIADIIKQVLSSLVYLHNIHIIHRDLKPQNILYDNESKMLKLIDFGTAVEYKNQKLHSLVGTAYYIAPQVINGQYDQKCDVWSVGVILYILLSGSPPFNGKSQKQIMKNILSNTVEFTGSIWNRRSRKSIQLVQAMLNKDPSKRISAFQALNSHWVVNTPISENNQLDGQIIQNLKNFHFKNKLKAVVFTYIASQLYSNKDKESLLRVFRQIDKDGDGVIQKDQLFSVFNQHSQSNLTEMELESIVKLIDTNGSGLIDFTQFLVAASKQSELIQRQRLQNAFSYLDTDHSGYISVDEVKAFLDGSEQTAEEIKRIFQEVDENKDGIISKKEFIYLLTKKE